MSKVSLTPRNDFCPQTLFAFGTYREDGKPDFGLFCWVSYLNDGGELGLMACIGEDKLTRDRIRATGVFSANLITEKTLPLADYLGCTSGYNPAKMERPIAVEKGRALDVPILADCPVSFELEVARTLPLDGGEVYLCKIRNVLADEALADTSVSIADRVRAIAPVHTTCQTYFGWDGQPVARWGGLKDSAFPQ